MHSVISKESKSANQKTFMRTHSVKQILDERNNILEPRKESPSDGDKIDACIP